jgi:hypothetical protein
MRVKPRDFLFQPRLILHEVLLTGWPHVKPRDFLLQPPLIQKQKEESDDL